MDRALRFTNQLEPLKPVMGPLSSVMHSGKCITASPSYQPTSLPQDKGKEGGKTKGEGILLHYQKDPGWIRFFLLWSTLTLCNAPHVLRSALCFLNRSIIDVIIYPWAFTFNIAFGEVHYGQHEHLCSAIASPPTNPLTLPQNKAREGGKAKGEGIQSHRCKDACQISLCYMEYPYST